MRKAVGLIMAVVLVGVVLWGCEEGIIEHWTFARVSVLEAPVAVRSDLDSFYVYRIKADEGYFPDSIVCSVLHGDSSLAFALLDDGGADSLWGPDFASVRSGDVVPHNGTYTRAINFRTLTGGTAADFIFCFAPYVHGMPDAGSGPCVTVLARIPQACSLLSWPQDSNFAECFAPVNMEVRVARDSSDRVDSVWVEVRQESSGNPFLNTLLFEATAGDTVWQRTFDPTAFSCAESSPPASYTLHYFAKTRFGLSADRAVAVHSFSNHLPTLSNSIMPDTTYRPAEAGVVDTITETVDFSDCALAGEIHYYGLLFDRSRDDTLNWSTHPDFFLRDDGLARDAVAGDSRYTVGLTITRSDTLLNNLYYFRFYAVDCAPPHLRSAYLLDSMRVIQSLGGAVSAASGGFDMGTANQGFRP
jgi:hypothetical protein